MGAEGTADIKSKVGAASSTALLRSHNPERVLRMEWHGEGHFKYEPR